ncbi:MAG TPA: HlyD family efflux transporter periplasmic adaptor subunit, partial [Gemmatimonadaceae bacterium]|nr:HlyD family efflux transporter periplasmic adaptor subunit [Gemmatimonadaceae bacterium]
MRRIVPNRRVVIAVLAVVGLLAIAFWPKTINVETATVTRGPLVVTIDEEGRTRVRDRYVVSAPVTGRVQRIDLEPGDPVRRGETVARVRAEAPALLDARSRAEAEAAVDSARAALGRARAEEQRARAALDQSQRDVERVRELAAAHLVAPQELDAREATARTASESVNAAVFAVRAATSELQRAEARVNPPPVDTGRIVPASAPIDGVVLKRLRE